MEADILHNKLYIRVASRVAYQCLSKIPQKTENLSKMVRGTLFGTFCSR